MPRVVESLLKPLCPTLMRLLTLGASVTVALGLGWSQQYPREGEPNDELTSNPDYQDRFVFTRIRYGPSDLEWGFRWGGARWSHDYPRADRHLSRLLSELTTMAVELEGTNVFELDDPALFHHPVAYISEPGFWTMSESEVSNLRDYVLKGGFLIFDDFENEQWDNLEAQLRRVLPEYRPIRIDVDHPIFHSFFDMETIYFPHPLVDVMPSYYGLFEDNDPAQRMVAIVNYNNDIAEYWEWSDTGWLPIDITNEAYKLGVNYMVYALTH
ncbi:MAG TPA: DUF4159 domain-containing protein [Vicinamibacteria bacterium]|nr:DUF4159 domain-containing protein [Vicinamibacteria bacterium]